MGASPCQYLSFNHCIAVMRSCSHAGIFTPMSGQHLPGWRVVLMCLCLLRLRLEVTYLLSNRRIFDHNGPEYRRFLSLHLLLKHFHIYVHVKQGCFCFLYALQPVNCMSSICCHKKITLNNAAVRCVWPRVTCTSKINSTQKTPTSENWKKSVKKFQLTAK